MKYFLGVSLLLLFLLHPSLAVAEETNDLSTTTDQIQQSPEVQNIMNELHIPPLLVSIFKVFPKPSSQTVMNTSTQIIKILSDAGLKKVDEEKYTNLTNGKFNEIEGELDSMVNNFKREVHFFKKVDEINKHQEDFFTNLEEKNSPKSKVAGEKIIEEKVDIPHKSIWDRFTDRFFTSTFSSDNYQSN